MSPKKQRAKKSLKKQKAKNQNKIEKFLVKTNVENEGDNPNDDEELQQKVKDLKNKIRELFKEKRELECLKFPKPYKLKDIPINYDATKFTDPSFGTHTTQLRLKFHEFEGCVISKFDEKVLVAKFNVFQANQVHVYGIKFNCEFNQEAEGMDFIFSKCFVPPMIKIRELLKQYPVLNDPKPIIRVLAIACQVFHDIQIQIDQFKEKSDPKYVTFFNTFNNRVIELSFQMVQRSTGSVFSVSIELHYDIYKPRPTEIFINSEEMPRNTSKELKKHCKIFYRYSIWNAFEIITNMGLKQHESVFYLLQGESGLVDLNTDKPTILLKKKSKVVNQILRDFTYDINDVVSVQKDDLDSSFDESNVEISNQSVKSSRKNMIKQSKVKGSDPAAKSSHPKLKKRSNKESEKSSIKNANQKRLSKTEKSEKSETSPRVKSTSPHLLDLDTRIKNRLEKSFNDKQQSNSNYTRTITKIVAKNKSQEIINPELTGKKEGNPKSNLAGKDENIQLKNISETEMSHESKKSRVQRSLEQSFTNAEISYRVNSSKIQTEDKSPERINPEFNDKANETSVFSVETIINSENNFAEKDKNQFKNISKSEKSQESKKSLRAQTRVKRPIKQTFDGNDDECRRRRLS